MVLDISERYFIRLSLKHIQVWAQILFNNTMETNGSEIESDIYFFET